MRIEVYQSLRDRKPMLWEISWSDEQMLWVVTPPSDRPDLQEFILYPQEFDGNADDFSVILE